MAKSLPAAITAGKGGDSERLIVVRISPEQNDKWEELVWATKDMTLTQFGPTNSADPDFVTDRGTLLCDFEDVSQWTVGGTGASQEADTLHRREGNQGLKLNATGGNSAVSTKNTSLDLSSMTNITFWVYIADLSKLHQDGLHIYFSTTTDWSKYFWRAIENYHCKKGWNRFTLAKNRISSYGGASWSDTIVRVRVRFYPDTGQDLSVTWDAIRMDYEATPKVIIRFDDGHESVLTKAKPVLDGNSQTASAFIVRDWIGNANRLTLANLGTLRDAGWDISNHSKSHTDLRGVSAEQLEDEVNGTHDWLVENGFEKSAKFLSYPYGYYNDTVLDKVREKHRLASCSKHGWYQPHLKLRDDNIDLLIGIKSVLNTTSVAEIQTLIDDYVANNGILVLLFHAIVDSGADESGEYLTADFQSISNYLKTKSDAGSLEVVTFSEYYDSLPKGGMLKRQELGTIRQSVDIELGGNVATVSELTLRILNPEYGGTNRFDQVFASHNLENRKAEVRLAFWTGSELALADTLLLHEFVIQEIEYDYGEYRIKCSDAGLKRHKEIPDLILSEDNYPAIPEDNKGKIAPLLYGPVADTVPNYVFPNARAYPIIRIDKNKGDYLIARNKCDTLTSYTPVLYFEDIHRFAGLYVDSGSFTVTYGRPTTVASPLGVDIKGEFYSLLEQQASQTSPTSLDYANAVDNSDSTYFTLGASQLLYLKVPMPFEFGAIQDEDTNLIFKIRFGTITGTGTMKYYNAEFDDGAGAFSTSGQAISSAQSDTTVSYVFGADKTAHGKAGDQGDQNDPWTFDEIATYEFGLTMNAASSAQIQNMFIYITGLIVRSVKGVLLIPRTGHAARRQILKRGAAFDHLESSDNKVIGARGAEFGAWIDADGRDNGFGAGDLIQRGAYAVEAILRDELGLTSSEIDYAAFDLVGNTTDGDRKDWYTGTAIESQASSINIIAEFCRQTGILYFQDYRNLEKVVALKKETSAKTIDRSTILADSIKVSLTGLDNLYNEFYFNYNRSWIDGNYRGTRYLTASATNMSSNSRSGTPNTYTGLCSDSQSKYNHVKRLTLDCDWITGMVWIDQLLKWFAEWLCYRKYVVQFSTALDHINLELGDQIKIDHTLLPSGVSNDDCFLVFDIKHDLDNDRLTFKAMQVPDLLP